MADLQKRPFALLGVNVNGCGPADLKAAMEKEHLPWRSFADPPLAGRGPIATSWNHTSTPTLYLIDHRGVIRNKWVGVPDHVHIDEQLEHWLRVAESADQRPPK